jgi:hypothetical protein
MGYKQNNPLPMMKSAMKMMKAERKAGMHRDSAMYMNSPMYSGHSPMEMGHDSPAKKYDSPMHRESRELKDMPIVDIEKGDAKGDERSGKRKGDERSGKGKPKLEDLKSKNKGPRVGDVKPGTIKPTGGSPYKDEKSGSPAKAAKPDYIDIDGDGDKSESMKEAAKDKKGSPAKMDEKSGKKKDERDGTIGKDAPGKPPKGPRIGPGGRPPKRDARKEQPKSKREYGKGSPAKKYDRVVLGGNKGDKSKTKPGKKDYSGNQPDLKKYSEDKKKK